MKKSVSFCWVHRIRRKGAECGHEKVGAANGTHATGQAKMGKGGGKTKHKGGRCLANANTFSQTELLFHRLHHRQISKMYR